jgi:hypothetical protein
MTTPTAVTTTSYLGSDDAIREVACWAHAQGKFVGHMRQFTFRDAYQILEWTGQLYDIGIRSARFGRRAA